MERLTEFFHYKKKLLKIFHLHDQRNLANWGSLNEARGLEQLIYRAETNHWRVGFALDLLLIGWKKWQDSLL